MFPSGALIGINYCDALRRAISIRLPPTTARARPPARREVPLKPVLASAAGIVEDVANNVPEAETSKYRTLVTADPSAAVELKVNECHPALSPAGKVTDVFTATLTAFPVPMV
jgi:hypothetical protein